MRMRLWLWRRRGRLRVMRMRVRVIRCGGGRCLRGHGHDAARALGLGRRWHGVCVG